MSRIDDIIIDEFNEEPEEKTDRIKKFIGDIPEQVMLDFPLEKVNEMGCDPRWADLVDPENDGEFIKKKTPKYKQKGYYTNRARERTMERIRSEFEAIRKG